MGVLVYAGTTSHVSGIVRSPDAHPEHTAALETAWSTMTERLEDADPDVVLVVAPDHHETFGLEHLPTFCVGAAEQHGAWNEHGIPGESVAGDPTAGLSLVASLVREGFDVSRAHEMTLDHGFLVPVQRLRLGERRILPLYVNCNTPPLPTMRRCRDLGLSLRRAIEDLPAGVRVAVLGTGGISHWVGVPRAGEINQQWDEDLLASLASGDLDPLLSMTDDEIIETAGNGALELRTWVVAAACAGEAGGRTLAYAPMRRWDTGVGVLELAVA